MSAAPHSDRIRHIDQARSIMLDFARLTGLSDTSRKPRRYLWTDAFAVCNFLALYRETGEIGYLQSARRLVEQVHFVLGRYAETDSRSGWISGLDEQAGYHHPTVGGLRIGKPLPERTAGQPLDERLEWDRDGQYFHYLTKWMQALTRMAAYTGDGTYQRWALELARVAHAGFTYRPAPSAPLQMYWKMSIDLSRPLVTSMGHHDPLEALVTYTELETNNEHANILFSGEGLEEEIAACRSMCAHKRWATEDPLGTGSLLVDTFRLAQMKADFKTLESVELTQLLADCETGLAAFAKSGQADYQAQHRLAFRELGLAIGLEALARLRELHLQYPHEYAQTKAYLTQLERLEKFAYLADKISSFWLQAAHQQVPTWRDHVDINRVMLATSLAPDAFLFPGPDTQPHNTDISID